MAWLSTAVCLCLAPTSGVEVAQTFVLSTTGSTRGTAYAMSNKIVVRNGKLHVAWLDTQSHTYVRTRDLTTGEWSDPVLVGVGYDNHGGPALTVDAAGYLHIVYGPHHHPMKYRRSVRPNDASEWTAAEEFGHHLTYPSLVCSPDGTLHLTARGGPNPPALVYHRKRPGEPWSERMTLLDPDIPPGYTQYSNSLAVDSRGRLHLAFHVYDQHQRAAGKLVGYLMSPDGGETWTKADGTPVAIPAKRGDVDVLEDDPQLDCRVGGIDVDAEGHPYFVVAHGRIQERMPVLWRYDGERWRNKNLGPFVRSVHPEWVGNGNATVCVAADGTVYIAAGAAAPGVAWGGPGIGIVLLISRDGGETFTATEVAPAEQETPNWLPSIERNTGHHPVDLPHLLYTHGVPGKGTKPSETTEIRCVTLRQAGE